MVDDYRRDADESEQEPDEPGPEYSAPPSDADENRETDAEEASEPLPPAPDDDWADALLEDADEAIDPARVVRELRAELERHLAARDKAAFVRAAVEVVTGERLTIPVLYADVLTPLLVDTGAGWQRGQVAIWEEHMASAMVRTVVEILYPGVVRLRLAAPALNRRVLLATPPEETHDLGLRMIADRFDMAGWTTYFLGADTPVEQLIDAARKLDVDAIVLSSATHYHRLFLREYVDQLKRELSHVHVWVGGSAFAKGDEGWPASELRDLDSLLADYSGPRGLREAG